MMATCKDWLHQGFFICPVCNEQFYIPPYVTDWRYKINAKVGRKVPVCSYSCLNKATSSKRMPLKGEHYLKNENKRKKSKMYMVGERRCSG